MPTTLDVMMTPSAPFDPASSNPTLDTPAAAGAPVSHAAQPAALGYIYQAEYALMALLRDGPERPDARITLEKFDDVAWAKDESPTDKLQTKYRRLSTRNLADNSPDLWKTIKSWLDGEAPTDREGPRLYLVTTETAAPDTAAAALRAGDRNFPEALRLLNAAAKTSTDKTTKGARDAYLAMSESDRYAFVSRIEVLDEAPHLPDVSALTERYLQPYAPYGREVPFMKLVVGWWHEIAIGLLDGSIDSISYDQARLDISRIRDEFLSDQTLPVAPGVEDPVSQQRRDELEAAHANRLFVRRMIDVAFPPQNLQLAVVDYYRAVSATTFWLQHSLITPRDITRFEAKLKEEWEREFEFMCADLPDGATDQDKQRAGQDLLRRLLDAVQIRIRPKYEERSLARGTRHLIADRNEIAWHPDFAAELQQLLDIT